MQCPLSAVQVQHPWRQSGRNKSDYGGKDLWTDELEVWIWSGVKGRGSDRWWERRWCLWWGDMRRMRRVRRRVSRMRLNSKNKVVQLIITPKGRSMKVHAGSKVLQSFFPHFLPYSAPLAFPVLLFVFSFPFYFLPSISFRPFLFLQ